jgi:hypothetical protein
MQMMPNFLIIGAAKSGTTALYNHLEQHPDVFMSRNKEPFFFAMEGETVDFRGPGDQIRLERTVCNNLKDYQELFTGAEHARARGEASTIYLYSAKAAQRIKHYIPGVKLIAILRNPADRAYSSFMHLLRDNREPYRDFEQALADEPRRIQEKWEPLWHYRQVGFYYESLKRYFDLFPPEQIRIYLYEDLNKDALGVVQSLYAFLGVDPTFTPDTSIRYNVSGIPKNPYLHSIQGFLLSPDQPVKTFLKPFIPERLRKRALHGTVGKIREVNFEHTPMREETRARLMCDYREDILKTQDIIGRDLSHWLTEAKPC